MFRLALTILVPFTAAMYILRKLVERSWGSCTSTKSLEGRVFIITGANSGLGKETARALAARKAKVVLACRDMVAAQKAIQDIRTTTSNGELISMHLNLSSLDSIRNFAHEVLRDFPQIHVLINNAGIAIPAEKLERTDDGFEAHFGVNHLGHFLLTDLLLDRLKSCAPSRIVIVSSLLHRRGEIDFSNLNGERKIVKPEARFPPLYCNTKLCNIYHAMELGRRLEGSGVTVYALCPGWCASSLMRYHSLPWYSYIMIIVFGFFFMRSSKAGAQTILQCATEDNLHSNYGTFGFYRNCKPSKSPIEFDPATAQKLWDHSESLVKAYKLGKPISPSSSQ